MSVYDAPPPLVLGAYSLASGAKAVILIHALACIFVISTASSVVEFTLGNLNVNVNLQIFTASWCVMGIAILVGAWVGMDSKQEWPLRVYFFYMVATLVLVGVALIAILAGSNHCELMSSDHTAQRVGTDFSCGMVSLLLFMGVLALFAILAYMTYIIWQLKEYLDQRESSAALNLDQDLIEAKMRAGGPKGTSKGGAAYGASYGAGGAAGRSGHLALDGGAGAAGRYGAGGGAPGGENADGYGDGGDMDEQLGLEEEQGGILDAMGLGGAAGGNGGSGDGTGAAWSGGAADDPYRNPQAFHGARGRFTASGAVEHPEWAAAPSGVQPGWGNIPIRAREAY